MTETLSGRLYFDWNASTPLLPSARAAMYRALSMTGNGSAIHAEGRAVREGLERARDSVIALAALPEAEAIFTSGATEAINQVMRAGWSHCLVSAVEHHAVFQAAKAGGAHIATLPVDGQGVVQMEALDVWLSERKAAGDSPCLVAVMAANNETGVLQPVGAIARRLHLAGEGFRLMADAAQAAGRLDLAALWEGSPPDYLCLSAHKMGGAPGAGALLRRSGAPLRPLIHGGGQEAGLRAGTENLPALAAFGAAAAEDSQRKWAHCAGLRDMMQSEIRAIAPETVVFGEGAPRLANTLAFAIGGWDAQMHLLALDKGGVAAGSGSACASGTLAPGHVARAMGYGDEVARAMIRLSIGPTVTERDVARFLDIWRKIHRRRKQGANAA